MKIIYKFGPHAGEVAHCPRSQEIQVLLNAGIIEEVPTSDADRVPDKDDVTPPKPARGWVACIYRSPYGDADRPMIIFHDGQGGHTRYTEVPAPVRRWNGEKQSYEFVTPEVPASVIAQFHDLSGNAKEAAIAREKAEREEMQRALESKHGRSR